MPSTPRQSPLKAALVRAAALCDRSEMCSAEILTKLDRWGISPDDAPKILAQLCRLGYVDDNRFARAYSHHKMAYSGWGRFKILAGLRAKGIDRETAAEALRSLDSEEYSRTAMRVMAAKLRSLGGNAKDYTTRMKLLRFGASRGFESSILSGIISSLASQSGQESE